MKYTTLFFVLLILFLLCLVTFFTLLHDESNSVQASLIINGKSIGANARICDDIVELPLIEVLGELGCTINCVDGNETEIIYNNKLFILNLKHLTFKEDGSAINLLTPAPGSQLFTCKLANNDIWLDDVSLKSVLYVMGILVDVQYCTNEPLVQITAQDG